MCEQEVDGIQQERGLQTHAESSWSKRQSLQYYNNNTRIKRGRLYFIFAYIILVLGNEFLGEKQARTAQQLLLKNNNYYTPITIISSSTPTSTIG